MKCCILQFPWGDFVSMHIFICYYAVKGKILQNKFICNFFIISCDVLLLCSLFCEIGLHVGQFRSTFPCTVHPRYRIWSKAVRSDQRSHDELYPISNATCLKKLRLKILKKLKKIKLKIKIYIFPNFEDISLNS